MTTTVYTTIRQRALYELDVGGVFPNADISAIGASSFTAARWFQNSNMAQDYLQINNVGLHRFGAATAADLYRPAGTLANGTGIVQQVGPTWADVTVGTEDIEWAKWGVRLDQEWQKSLNRITEFEFVTSMHLLSGLSIVDGGNEALTDTNYTDVGTPTTSAKSSAGLYGPRSYRLVGDAVNEGTRHSTGVTIAQGRYASAYAIVTADSGTASFRMYDLTNSVDIGTAVTHSERTPMLLMIQNQQVPATCKAVTLTMLGTTNPSDIYWNQIGLYARDNLQLRLPAFVNEGFLALKLYQGVPQTSIAANVYDAGSLDFRPLTEGVDYWIVINHADAVPYKIRLRAGLPDYPFFLEYRRPLSDLTTFSAETDSTTGPLHKIVPRFKKDLLETVYNTGSRRHPDWTVQHNLAVEQLAKAGNSRMVESIALPKPYWAPRLGAG